MPLTPDQIMMFAHMADWAGSRMAPDNPFAGYAQQFVGARNFAKMMQQRTPEGVKAPAGPVAPSALSSKNPFDPAYQPMQYPGEAGKPSLGSKGAVDNLKDTLWMRGVESTLKTDKDNNWTLTHKVPSTPSEGGSGGTTSGQQTSAANPFWFLS